jgi:hypothetical protein
MRKTAVRVLATAIAVAALSFTTGGVASAAEVPIWALPGVDLGDLLGPATGVPGAAAPVFDLLKLIGA